MGSLVAVKRILMSASILIRSHCSFGTAVPRFSGLCYCYTLTDKVGLTQAKPLERRENVLCTVDFKQTRPGEIAKSRSDVALFASPKVYTIILHASCVTRKCLSDDCKKGVVIKFSLPWYRKAAILVLWCVKDGASYNARDIGESLELR